VDALVLGLSSGASCLASCAPFLVPALAAEGGAPRGRRLGLLGLFLAGRLLSYAAVGALAGSFGALAAGYLPPSLDRALLRAGWALGGAALLAGGLAGFKGRSFCRALASREKPGLSALALGVAAGLNLCPPFAAAASRALGLGALGGIGYFLLFFVGTSAWILPFGFAPRLGPERAAALRSGARVLMALLGAYFLVVLGLLGWS
jgi:sulfite exporter TauE/SafE